MDVTLATRERLGHRPERFRQDDSHQLHAGLLLPEADGSSICGEDITAEPAHKRARKGIARSFQIPRPLSG